MRDRVGDRGLDDAGIVTFLRRCACRSAHAGERPPPGSADLRRGCCRSSLSMAPPDAEPEHSLSILGMRAGFVFDRIDPSLRVCFTHRRQSFPMWLGRIEATAWRRRRSMIATSGHPRSLLSQSVLPFDSVTFRRGALQLLVDVSGWTQVIVSSGYLPSPLGGRRPRGTSSPASATFPDKCARAVTDTSPATQDHFPSHQLDRRERGPLLSSSSRISRPRT